MESSGAAEGTVPVAGSQSFRRKQRTAFSIQQLQYLETVFEHSQYPGISLYLFNILNYDRGV